jgi:hypothetical protein
MSAALQRTIHEEVDLVQRFTQTYRAKLAEVIDRLNHAPPSPTGDARPDGQTIRWCVEAVDMVLASQAEFAKAMHRLAAGTATGAAGNATIV